MSEIKKKRNYEYMSETAVIYLHKRNTALNRQNFEWFLENTRESADNIFLLLSPNLVGKNKRELHRYVVKRADEKETDLKIFIDFIKSEQILYKFKKIVFTTSDTAGPFTGPKEEQYWIKKFTSKLCNNIHMTGPFIRLVPAEHPLSKNIITKQNKSSLTPYLPLTSFAITNVALSLLIDQGVFENVIYKQEDERVIMFDIPVTSKILENGWNISCMLDKYSGIDYGTVARDPNPHAHHGDPSFLNSYFGDTVSRNDLIFSNRVCDQVKEVLTQKNSNLTCYMIYYDCKTKNSIEPGFKKLDNTLGYPALREAYPIAKFLSENTTAESGWLGFFSPKFGEKTKIDYSTIERIVNNTTDDTDVCLFSSNWEGAAAYPNVWVQGEFYHPGLLDISQDLAKAAGYDVDLEHIYMGLDQAVFSNFFVAKPSFWEEWLRITSIYLKQIISSDAIFARSTSYRDGQLSIHPFVIERIPSMILLCNNFKASFDLIAYNEALPVDSKIGNDLIKMANYKQLFKDTSNATWLSFYQYHLTNYQTLLRKKSSKTH